MQGYPVAQKLDVIIACETVQ